MDTRPTPAVTLNEMKCLQEFEHTHFFLRHTPSEEPPTCRLADAQLT
jgi:hypothetical protein